MSQVSIPLISGGGGGVSLPRVLHGIWVETNDMSDYVWTFSFIRGLIKEVYRAETTQFPFLGK